MIHLQFQISRPRWFSWEFTNIDWVRHGRFLWFKHKFWEIQLGGFPYSNLFGILIDTDLTGSDHAGPRVELELLGISLIVQVHDSRHWDYEAKTWQEPPD